MPSSTIECTVTLLVQSSKYAFIELLVKRDDKLFIQKASVCCDIDGEVESIYIQRDEDGDYWTKLFVQVASDLS
jgi:hypothetical protein